MVFCDKVNYAISVKTAYLPYQDFMLNLLNSILFRFLVDLFSRQLTGAQTLSDVDVNVVETTLIPDPTIFTSKQITEILELGKSLKKRE